MGTTMLATEGIDVLDQWIGVIAEHAANDKAAIRVNYDVAMAMECVHAIAKAGLPADRVPEFVRSTVRLAELVIPMTEGELRTAWVAFRDNWQAKLAE